MPETVTLTRESWKSLQADGQYGRVFVVTETVLVDDDGNAIRANKHRRSIEPDADISKEPPVIRRICEAVRTDGALTRYNALRAAEGAEE
jgi:hypothetical protein